MIVDMMGWIGAAFVLGAYYASSIGRVSAADLTYQIANFVGAVMIGINTYIYGAYPSTVVNVLWALIAIRAMLSYKENQGKMEKLITKRD